MGKHRRPSFPFYPRDFMADRAVAQMTPEELGGYVMLLCHAWMSDEPGILPDDDRLLGALSRLGGRWPECRAGVLRAFIPGPGETLIQVRMREESHGCGRDAVRRSASGTHAANVRWGNKKDAARIRKDAIASASAFASAFAEAKNLHPSTPNGAETYALTAPEPKRTKAAPPKQLSPPDQEWRAAFFEQFWPAYLALGRKCSKAEALKAWGRIPHADLADDFNTLMDAFEASCAEWKGRSDRTFYPHAATWLNDYRANLNLEA